MEEINSLLEKYDNFKDAQIRSIVSAGDDSQILTLVTMDDFGMDVDTIKIEFSGIKEAKYLENSFLPYLDMMNGVTLIKEHDLYGFAPGNDTAMLHVHNAPLYIVASDVKVLES